MSITSLAGASAGVPGGDFAARTGATTVVRARARRLAAGIRTAGSALHGRRVVYARRSFGDVELVLRAPELRDAAQWRATRLREQDRLAHAFGDTWGSGDPEDTGDWYSRHSDLAWTQRCLGLRRASAGGAAVPAVIATRSGAILGELGVDTVDPRTRTGEVSAWTSRHLPSRVVASWALQAVVARAFTAPDALLRLVAPVAVTNPGPAAALTTVGFRRERTARAYRRYAGTFTDHDIFVLQRETWQGDDEITT